MAAPKEAAVSKPNDLSQTVLGVTISHQDIEAALAGVADAFNRADFTSALDAAVTAPVSSDMAHRVLQSLKRKKVITFDKTAQLWRKPAQPLVLPGALSAEPLKTLPLLEATSAPPVLRQATFPRWQIAVGTLLQFIACIGLISALITLNASFAWELGREAEQFRAAFVVGLMALDLMRPFLVAAGFALISHGRLGKAMLGFAVAFMLSPVSVLSSTAILSSSFLLGAEMNADVALQTATLESLRGEHTRRLAEAERLQDAWRSECERGGCGPLAQKIEAEFLTAQTAAQTVLDRIVRLTEASNGASDLLARLVITFERLGIFGQGREILLPLFLALSLELGALFGPAFLLSSSNHRSRRGLNAAQNKAS